MTAGGRDAAPWKVLALAGVALYLLLPVRMSVGRWQETSARIDGIRSTTAAIDDRTDRATSVDVEALRVDLEAIGRAMPVGAIDGWIEEVSGLARSTGTTWRSATVTGSAAAPPGEPGATTVEIAVDGPARGLLAFVDGLRVGTARLTLVDSFAVGTAERRSDRPDAASTLAVTVRLLSFVPSDPPAVGA